MYQNLRALRESLNMTQEQFGKSLGLAKTTYSNYENGDRQPSSDFWIFVAQKYGVTIDYLMGFSNDPTMTSNQRANVYTPISKKSMKIARSYDELDVHGKRIVDSVIDEEIRRMAEEKAAKEKAAKAAEEMEAAQEITPVRYIRHYLVPSAAGFASPVEGEDYEMIEAGPEVPANADFCIEISGDSMEPYIKDGQRVYVQRDVNVREFDDAGIWYYAGDVLCKQYCIDFSGALILLSANRKRRNFDKWISKEERVNVVCYGRVILPFKLPQPEP